MMIEQFYEGLARIIVSRPKIVAGLIFVMLCIGLYGLTLLTMQTGWETYIDKDSPSGALQAEYHDNFQADAIILIIEAGDPLSPDTLAYIDTLETDFRQQQNIRSAYSIVDVLKSANGGTLPSSRQETDLIVASIPENARSQLVPSNVLTLVQIKLVPRMSDSSQNTVLNTVGSIIDKSNPPPGVTVKVSGTPAFTQQMKAGLGENMGILIGGAMILMVLTMGILFSYVRYRFMPVLIVGTGLIISLGLMGIAGISLNMAVIGAFPVMIGLGIDYAIQFHARFDEEARKGSLEDAVFMTVTRTGPAVLYAMLATCAGFLAMFISEVPMIRSFGLVAIIGIFSCYWVSCLGMPALGLLLTYKPKEPETGQCYATGTDACNTIIPDRETGRDTRARKKGSFSYGSFLTDISMKIAKNPVPVLLLAGLIALIGFQIDPNIQVQSDENAMVPSGMPAKINFDKVTRIMGSTSTADYLIRGSRVTDLDTVVWMREFQEYELSHHAELTASSSIADAVLQYNNGMMPETQAELNAVLARIPDDTRNDYLSGSMSGVIKFSTVKLSMVQMNNLKKQMNSDVAFLDPPVGIALNPAGSFELYTKMLESLSESKETMIALGFIMVFIFLLLVYRHVHAVSPIIPIIFVVGWNAVMMYLLGIDYTPLTATLGSMTIGVAAEYTILVMERYTEEEERLHDPLAAIQESVQKIGTAITISGLATFFGFSALCLATFPIISNFGITTLIAVAFSLIGAIFVMPAVLSFLGGLSERLDARKTHGTQGVGE
jgi:hydrophobe/amphiphile efflux-3 (HAE3) family protein